MILGMLRAKPIGAASSGIVPMLLFTVCVTGMLAGVRHVSAEIHPFEILFFRLVFGLVVIVPWLAVSGLRPFRTRRIPLLWGRAVLNVGAMLAVFSALSLAPFADIMALSFTSPILATLIAAAILGEAMDRRRWGYLVLGMVGVLVVLRPGLQDIGAGLFLALLASALWAMTLIVVKVLGETDSSVTIAAYMSLMMAPLSLPFALMFWEWPTVYELGWLVGIGVLGGAAEIFMAEALKRSSAAEVMPLDFMKLIWASVLGFAVFGEVPDVLTWLGGGIILAAAVLSVTRSPSVKTERRPADHLA